VGASLNISTITLKGKMEASSKTVTSRRGKAQAHQTQQRINFLTISSFSLENYSFCG
jgi:hypothetical protein